MKLKFINIFAGISISTFAGMFYMQERPGVATFCVVFAFLFTIGYFDIEEDEEDNKKSVK